MRELTFTYENINKYYQKKFMFDMSNYFVIEGWNHIPRGTFLEMTEQNIIRKLYKLGSGPMTVLLLYIWGQVRGIL